jgi:phage shock protein C
LEDGYNAGMKKLYRSSKDRTFFGVVGGLGEYFSVDPVILRLVWIFVTVVTGFVPGLILYLISAAIVPDSPRTEVVSEEPARHEAAPKQ